MSQSIIFSYMGMGLPGLNQYYARINVFCSRTQHSDTGEARARNRLGHIICHKLYQRNNYAASFVSILFIKELHLVHTLASH